MSTLKDGRYLGGIVTYNPDLARLKDNISHVINQVDYVLVYDNSSDNIDEIKRLMEQFDSSRIEIYPSDSNKGIASALKYIMDYAISNEYNWVLSLDQDSIVPDNLISVYEEYIDIPKIGGITCNIVNKASGDIETVSDVEYAEVDECITSAFFMRVKAYMKTKGYDEWMFIDGVDHDICYALKDAGYRIIRTSKVELDHIIGEPKLIRWFGKEEYVFNHSPFRAYYLVRNAIYLAKKYPDRFRLLRVIMLQIKIIIKGVMTSDQKLYKLNRFIKGFIDGIKIKV